MDRKIIVGLGNPGSKYQNTRHNIGFKVVEQLACRYGVDKEESRFNAIIGHVRINSNRVCLVKPLTFMNLSGKAVQPLINWYKIDLSELLIIYDDMDLELGSLRFRPGGGSGGHKGMESIITCTGKKGIPRMRIGIGRPEGETINWVLGRFKTEEKMIMEKTINNAADAAEHWIKNGIISAMNEYN